MAETDESEANKLALQVTALCDQRDALRRDLDAAIARAECAEANHDTVLDEVERLRGWKHGATIVLVQWERVAESLGVGATDHVAPKELGCGRSTLALGRIVNMRAQRGRAVEALRALCDTLVANGPGRERFSPKEWSAVGNGLNVLRELSDAGTITNPKEPR